MKQSTSTVAAFRERLLHRHQIETEWPIEIEAELAQLSENAVREDSKSVIDLTHVPFVTIDGENAKDFDDAVFCEQVGDGFCLDVAIADVARWVVPGGALDGAARERGNSVYLPGQVVPMLPELLSNDLCSLRPGQLRDVFVCRLRIDHQGGITGYDFIEAQIISAGRLTYEAASEFLAKGVKGAQGFSPEIEQSLLALWTVSKGLFAHRIGEGSLHLVFPETVAPLNQEGLIEDISSRPRLAAASLIEECMLAANVCAAQRLDEWFGEAIYRCHEAPELDALRAIKDVLGLYGVKMRPGRESAGRRLTRALESVEQSPAVRESLQMLVLRSLKQAYYSAGKCSHFGLGFAAYTHFTSPIRRYPDLIAHRMLKATLGYPARGAAALQEAELSAISEHCSHAERTAEVAEREMMGWLKAEFIGRYLGEAFSGTVSGVTSFGVFVTLDTLPIDGLVHISDLGQDYFEFDERFLTLTGRRSGRRIRLGDRFEVKVAGVELEEGKVNLLPTVTSSPPGKLNRSSKRPKAKTKRRPPRKTTDRRRRGR